MKYIKMYKGNNVHSDSLQVGHEYQDFIVEQMSKQLHMNLSLYQSKKYQYSKGESLQKYEIKYDARSTGDNTYYKNTPTGNVGIECFEKINASNAKWVKSGVLREDNTIFYIVGNYHQAWIFSKKHLRLYIDSKNPKIIETLPTIKSLLIPISEADRLCTHKLIF